MSYDIDELMQHMGKPGGMQRSRVNPERNKLFCELVDRGYSYRQIGLQFGISAQAVMNAVRNARKSAT